MTAGTRTCLMCGLAEYEEVVSIPTPMGSSVLGIVSIGAANKWRVARCPSCGNVQLFLVER